MSRLIQLISLLPLLLVAGCQVNSEETGEMISTLR